MIETGCLGMLLPTSNWNPAINNPIRFQDSKRRWRIENDDTQSWEKLMCDSILGNWNFVLCVVFIWCLTRNSDSNSSHKIKAKLVIYTCFIIVQWYVHFTTNAGDHLFLEDSFDDLNFNYCLSNHLAIRILAPLKYGEINGRPAEPIRMDFAILS
jgi:hypothetical protein